MQKKTVPSLIRSNLIEIKSKPTHRNVAFYVTNVKNNSDIQENTQIHSA